MIQLNYKTYGQGENVLIILHGFLGSLDNWHSLATAWGNLGIKVYALDQRNHGKSPHTPSHSIGLMVNDLVDFLDAHGIDKATILGHSMGGKVAMQFALDYANRCNGIIIADMAPRAYRAGTHDDVFKAIANVDLSKALTRKEVEEAMAVYLGDFGTRQFIMKGLERVDEAHYKWKFNAKVLARDYANIINQIHSNNTYPGKAWFINGGNSLYVQEKDLPLIEQLFPNYQLHTVAQAGHWLHADKPAEFGKLVMHYFGLAD